MAEIYRFFNSTPEDKRLYQADDFAGFFSEFLSSGLVHRDGEPFISLKMGEDSRTQTVVTAGSAILEGHLYKNTANIKLTHTKEIYPKIDRVVLRLDKSLDNRFIKIFIKEGKEDLNAPELIREGDIYEISLANVRVSNTATQDDLIIVDERFDEELGGIVDSMISVPMEDLQDNFDNFKNQLNDDFYVWFDDAIRQSNVELLEEELNLIKQNQIEILMYNYIMGQSTDMDAGYFFDVLRDWSKLNQSESTAILDTINMNLSIPKDKTEAVAVWEPHDIGFITSKVKHYHTRPIQNVLTLKEDALSGQNKIKVENVSLTITEVD